MLQSLYYLYILPAYNNINKTNFWCRAVCETTDIVQIKDVVTSEKFSKKRVLQKAMALRMK